jgi:ketosteroid isomerase-like protein
MLSRKLISGTIAALIVAVAAVTTGPALAQAPMPAEMPQPTQQDNLRVVATNLNNQRSELFRKKDLAGLTSLYTPDAAYIELMPRLSVMTGRAQIQQHMNELMAAKASDLVLTIKSAGMTGEGRMIAGGDYHVMVKGGKKVFGHFFQELREDAGGWKIAKHVFARNELLTPNEARNLTLAPRSGVPSAKATMACTRVTGGGGGIEYLDCLAREAEKESEGRPE